ncbi:MAG: type II toxin-antitoxin system YafQ family toxin [Propionibacteriaceae bacterium]|nr:type II toxin-antitoxin system YafQ family toxin [Propionibacteriaceae bacterium]
MTYTIKETTQFRKDYKRIMKRGRDRRVLALVINHLAQGKKLDPSYRDHALTGDYAGQRECHLAPDWLLVYVIDHEVLVLSLMRTGSHSDLF